MACTTKNEVIKELRDIVGLKPGKELQAVSAILDIIAKVEVPSVVPTTLKKGEVFAHVSNAVFEKFAVAGDVLPDGWVFNTLGSHIGSKDTVDEYIKQTGEKNPVVYDVTVSDDAKVLQMEDVGDSNWTADNMYEQLKAKFPKIPLTKKSTPEATLAFLRKQGYDAIGYENTEEGGVSYMVLNPSKFQLKAVDSNNKKVDLEVTSVLKGGIETFTITNKNKGIAKLKLLHNISINDILKNNELPKIRTAFANNKMLSIDNIEVDEDFQQQGYGKQLLDSVMEKYGNKDMFLWAYADTDFSGISQNKLEEIYKNLGFTEVVTAETYGTYMYRAAGYENKTIADMTSNELIDKALKCIKG